MVMAVICMRQLSFFHHPAKRDLNREIAGLWCDFPTVEIIATHLTINTASVILLKQVAPIVIAYVRLVALNILCSKAGGNKKSCFN